jgi:hypothetical protein
MNIKLLYMLLAVIPEILKILKQLDDRHYDLDPEEKKQVMKAELEKVSKAIKESNAEALNNSFSGP